MVYKESVVFNNFFNGVNFYLSALAFGTCIFNKWIRNLCFGLVIYKPG